MPCCTLLLHCFRPSFSLLRPPLHHRSHSQHTGRLAAGWLQAVHGSCGLAGMRGRMHGAVLLSHVQLDRMSSAQNWD